VDGAPLLTNGPITFPSTNVDETSQIGFDVLHADNQQMLQAMNAYIQGQGILQGIDSNGFWNDGIWIASNAGVTSSGLSNVVYAIERLPTNVPPSSPTGASNVWVMNWPSNLLSGSNQFSVSNFVAITNGIGLSNVATETTLAGISNLMGGWDSNAMALAADMTNSELPMITNSAMGRASDASNSYMSAAVNLPTDLSMPDAGEPTVPVGSVPEIGNSVAFTLSTAILPINPFHQLRSLLGLFCWLGVYIYLLREFWKMLAAAFGIPQLEGNKQAAFGFNLELPTALAFAALFGFAVITFMGTVSYAIAHGGSLASLLGLNSALNGMAGTLGAAWNLVAYGVPLADLTGSFVFYIVTEFLVMRPLAMVCIVICKFLMA
jgi:hypothetical protein